MEFMLLAVSPAIVSFVTDLTKKAGVTKFFKNGSKKIGLRFIIALLSFGAVAGGAFLAGEEVDAMSIETMVKSAGVFVGAIVPYMYGKMKKPYQR